MARRGFTLIELLFLLLILGLLGGLMLPSLGRARSTARQIKDATQIRGIHQGLILFAQNNNDLYPLPSVLDKANATVDVGMDTGLKDNPKNVISILNYSGFISPELTLSPAESNADFGVDSDYSHSEPSSAKDPKMALWDPSFKGPPGPSGQGAKDEDKGNLSYALRVLLGARREAWSNTFNATEAVIGNRGPWYELGGGAWRLSTARPVDALAYAGTPLSATASSTLLIHGGRETWEGNIAYNDNHVSFQSRPDPDTDAWTFKGLAGPNKVRLDNLFVSEDDDLRTADADSLTTPGALTRKNNYLRLWQGGTAKGADLVDLKGAWFAD
jgi:type II secretory pathway pseudopilin PulG